MTIFFRLLSHLGSPTLEGITQAFYDSENIPVDEWNNWLDKWWKRVSGEPNRQAMLNANPKYVLRNWMAQLAIDAAENEDYSVCYELYIIEKSLR